VELIASSIVLNFVTILRLQLLAFVVLCNNLVQTHVEAARAVWLVSRHDGKTVRGKLAAMHDLLAVKRFEPVAAPASGRVI